MPPPSTTWSGGFPRSLLERSRVGYCAGDQLLKYLGWRKLPVGAALRAGLLTDDGREFLAGRIIFPEIRAGRVIWLIGRALDVRNAHLRLRGTNSEPAG